MTDMKKESDFTYEMIFSNSILVKKRGKDEFSKSVSQFVTRHFEKEDTDAKLGTHVNT